MGLGFHSSYVQRGQAYNREPSPALQFQLVKDRINAVGQGLSSTSWNRGRDWNCKPRSPLSFLKKVQALNQGSNSPRKIFLPENSLAMWFKVSDLLIFSEDRLVDIRPGFPYIQCLGEIGFMSWAWVSILHHFKRGWYWCRKLSSPFFL